MKTEKEIKSLLEFEEKMAKEKGVRIVTIGVGIEKGGLIPLEDSKGNIVPFCLV